MSVLKKIVTLTIVTAVMIKTSQVSATSKSVDIINVGLTHECIEDYYPVGDAYTINWLNVRADSTDTAPIIRTLKPGEKVEVLRYVGDWAKIEDGYCYAGYLSSAWFGQLNIHGDTDDACRYLGYAYQQFGKIPENGLNLLQEYDITLCENGVRNVTGNNEVVAQGRTRTSSTEKKIWLEASVEALQDVPCHEAGHAYDHSFVFAGLEPPSSGTDFLEAFEHDNSNYLNYFETHEMNVQTPTEYYAEAYKTYVLYPQKLKEVLPLTYQALEADIHQK